MLLGSAHLRLFLIQAIPSLFGVSVQRQRIEKASVLRATANSDKAFDLSDFRAQGTDDLVSDVHKDETSPTNSSHAIQKRKHKPNIVLHCGEQILQLAAVI